MNNTVIVHPCQRSMREKRRRLCSRLRLFTMIALNR